MQTYALTPDSGRPLYEQLYLFLRGDILAGKLLPGQKLPSKRSLSGNLGVSSITVESAYNRLIDEGFLISEPRRGYFVSGILPSAPPHSAEPESGESETRDPYSLSPAGAAVDLSSNRSLSERFPFSVWARLLRETVTVRGSELLLPVPCSGVPDLREAIAGHLLSFRGMQVSSRQIVIGAGTEYLYGILIQLLGRDRIYCLEDPGYRKIAQIYAASGAECRWSPMDDSGISIRGLEASRADIVHISPNHHFPTGITMPVGRRSELLDWVASAEGRYIIEDDYDSEFRLTGRPLPTLQSVDRNGRVIYMNTFSRTLAATIRISYMVLPVPLAEEYYRRLSFYSSAVSSFEQYTLASFISRGYFEKHINRMRLYYARLRKQVIRTIAESELAGKAEVIERDSGLHFLLRLDTSVPDSTLLSRLADRGIHLVPLSAYYHDISDAPEHTFLVSYSALSVEELRHALAVLSEII